MFSRPLSTSASRAASGADGSLPAVTGSIAIGNIGANAAFKRGVPVEISGTYTVSDGLAVLVMARFAGGNWQALDPTPSGGVFSGSLILPAGYGALEVRMNASATMTDSAADVSVGEVFLILGQSNADGMGTNFQSYSGTRGSNTFRSAAWQDTADPTGENSTHGSPWPLLAGLLEDSLGVPVSFVVGETAGGTALVVAPQAWAQGGSCYTASVTAANDSGVNRFSAILWYQGEAEAKAGVTGSTYATALSAVLDDFQGDIPAAATAKMIAALIGPSDTATADNLDTMRAGIIAAWDADADILPGPPAHAVFNPSDGLHWATDGELQRLAALWHRCIMGNLFSGPSARGPVPVSYLVGTGSNGLTNAQVRVTFNGGAPFANGTSVTGWAVTDGRGACTINSIATSGNEVTITTSQELAESVYVSYGKGETAMAATMVDGLGDIGFPPEPIVSALAGTGTGTAASTLLTGLVAWWTMDETTGNREDSHGTLDLVAANGPGYTTGKKGNAATLTGAATSPSLSVADAAAMDFSTGFSFSGWIKMTGSTSIFLKNTEFLLHWATNTLLFRGTSTGGSGFDGRKILSAADVRDGNWHHVVVSSPASGPQNAKIYIDGTRRDDSSNYGSPGWSAWNNTANVFSVFPVSNGHPTCTIDEAAIWNRDLTTAEIAELYNSGSGITYTDL